MRIPYCYHWALGSAMLVLLGLMALSVATGTVSLTLGQVLGALGLADVPVSEMVTRIVVDLRLPRTLLAALTGAGLAMVGALLQTTTRNDLADPFLFGLSSGASAGAVLVITRFGDRLGALTLPASAFAGGICSAVAVMLLFHFKKQRGAEHLVLCGLAISFLFGALTSYLIFSGDQRAASSVLFWSLGGLGLASWSNLPFAVLSVLLLPAAMARTGRHSGRGANGALPWDQRQPPAGRDFPLLRSGDLVSGGTDRGDRLCRPDGAASVPPPGGRKAFTAASPVRGVGSGAVVRGRYRQPDGTGPAGVADRHYHRRDRRGVYYCTADAQYAAIKKIHAVAWIFS